ncbi:MAG: hypothetical protein FWC10_02075 [Lentimicrobiaceae bacterium]|nr:hypothetical protein [Lentimicrobiaceae bacterium]
MRYNLRAEKDRGKTCKAVRAGVENAVNVLHTINARESSLRAFSAKSLN